MDSSSESKEKRRHPRVLINLPVNLWIFRELKTVSGFVLNASEGGLLIQTFKDMSIGTRIDIKVLFKILLSKGVRSAKFRAVANIIWKDTYWWEDWEGYQYGLKFIQILDEDSYKLKLILNNRPDLEEVTFTRN
jgi:hypothetical protein